MTSAGNAWDEDEDTETTTEEADDSDDSSYSDTDTGSDDSDDRQTDDSDDAPATTDGDGAQTLAEAAPHEVEAHRNLIGETLQHLSEQGIDVEELAEHAGVDSTDVDELTHGDLVGVTQYLAQHHPEALQEIGSRYPAAQGILNALTDSSGGLLGRLFGR